MATTAGQAPIAAEESNSDGQQTPQPQAPPPTITLYWLNQSRSQRILWLLEELGAPYEVQRFRRDGQTLLAPAALERVHPLGKSPVVSIAGAGPGGAPLVLAESGFMTEYLCQHLPAGARLVPPRWREGAEGRIGGETEAWMRHQYYLHYAEGSLMPMLLLALILGRLKSPAVPFFIRPFTAAAANRIFASYIFPNAQKHLAMLEDQLATSGGRYLCGDQLTAADILVSFPLLIGQDRFDQMGSWEGGSWKASHPRLLQYIRTLEAEPGYQRSLEKIKALNADDGPEASV